MISLEEKIFNEDAAYVSFEKYFEASQTTLWCKVMLWNKQFVENQKDIFQEVLGDLVEFLQSEDIYIDEIRTAFEEKLQVLNTKLQAFAEKMQDENHYDLSGVMHLIVKDQYISSLIGPSSLLIFRDENLVYSVWNEVSPGKIDLFSDLIEWDLEEDDTVLIWWSDVNVFLDHDDLQKVSGLSESNDIGFVQQLLDILSVRIDQKKLWFYQDLKFSTWKKITQKKLKKSFGKGFKFLENKAQIAWKYSSVLQYVLWGLFVLLLTYRALSWFIWDAKTVIKDENGDVLIDYGIEDIQQDIGIFKQMKANSNEKVKKYNEIIHRLDLLEENNLWVYDVTELRSILDQDYKDGFNIKLINTTEILGEPVYSFSQQEKNTMWDIRHVYYRNWFHVSGEDGVLIWAINESVRWSLVASAIWNKLEACNLNLLKNGLLCSSSDGSIYNTDKNWFTPVTTADKKFPRAIQSIGTRRTANMYVLTNDQRINTEGTYIIKYQNNLGSQSEFWESTRYVIDDSFNETYWSPFGSGVTSFAIDGTFLVRSTGQKKLYQMYRDGDSDVMIWRELALIWWDSVSNPYSENTKIIATAESRYIYLFDPDSQNFTVYRSTPYKTTPWWEREWQPDYAFMIKFDLSEDLTITDVFVEEGEKSNIFLLTKDNIYKVPLHEYIQQYLAEQE